MTNINVPLTSEEMVKIHHETVQEQKEINNMFTVNKTCEMCGRAEATHADNTLCTDCWADCEGIIEE